MVWFVWDRENNNVSTGALPADVFATPTGPMAQMSLRNHNKVGRFHMLKIVSMRMSPDVLCPCMVPFYIPLIGKQVQYTGIGQDWSNVIKGGVQIFASVSPTAVTSPGNALTLTINARTVYIDV